MNDNFERNTLNNDIYMDEKFYEPIINSPLTFKENNENNKANKENTEKLSTRLTRYQNSKPKKLGRKKKIDKENRKHNKYCEDNIIKKIKKK